MGDLWSSLDNTICQPPKLKVRASTDIFYKISSAFFSIFIVFSQYLACSGYFYTSFIFQASFEIFLVLPHSIQKVEVLFFFGGGG